MTSKLTRLTDEELAELAFYAGESTCHPDPNYLLGFENLATGSSVLSIVRELQERRKAAMDSEPVAWTDEEELRDVNVAGIGYLFGIDREANKFADPRRQIMLYRHAQPAPVVDIEPTQMFGIGSIFKPQVVSEQEADCDDCAHYNPKICHGEGCPAISQQSAQPAPVVLDDTKLRELFDSWFASDCSFDLSPEASEADNIAWRESYWYVWQRCSAAMLQAGNSPEQGGSRCGNSSVIPDGYVLVPKEPTEEMNKAGWSAMNEHDAINPTYRAMLAAAQHDTPALNSLQSVDSVADRWIPVSERMPDVGVKVLCFPVKDEPIHATFNGQLWLQDVSWSGSDDPIDNVIPVSVTHWMPLPAAPQEVK